MRILTRAVALVLTALMAAPATAQDRPAPAAEVAVGWVGFPDDGLVSETLVGGAARWYLSPRVAIGPEVFRLGGPNHSHLVVTGNVTFDLLTTQPVTPFIVIGGGMFQTREPFPAGDFTSREGAFTAGGGVRASLGDRAYAGVDVRVGWETHIRVNGVIGVRLR